MQTNGVSTNSCIDGYSTKVLFCKATHLSSNLHNESLNAHFCDNSQSLSSSQQYCVKLQKYRVLKAEKCFLFKPEGNKAIRRNSFCELTQFFLRLNGMNLAIKCNDNCDKKQ